MMVFPQFRKRIKPHLLLHFSTLIPLLGPPRYLDEARTEGYNFLVKLFASLTKGGG